MKSIARWDPFRAMRRWDPFADFREMQYEMDRLLDRMGRDTSVAETFNNWLPAVESYRRGDTLTFKCELPGMDPKEVEVTVDETGRELIIKGERKTEKDTKEEDYIHRELTYGGFERRFVLPEGVKTDAIKAKFTNGILEITVPSSQISSKAKKIEIEGQKVIEGEKDVKKAA
jgi:HSP20 family protein